MRRLKIIWLAVVLVPLAILASAYRVFSTSDTVSPQVIQTTPALGEELPVTSAVTFRFDYPMDHSSVERAFKVSPALKGSFTWPDDMTVAFQPSEPFQRATEYLFTIDQTAASAVGVPMRDKFTLKLRTAGFLEVSQVLPADGTREVGATPTITVIFNRPVVPLMPPVEMARLPNLLTIVPAVEGESAWVNTSIYTFKPKALRGGTTYTVTVNKGLTDVTGSALQEDFTFTFSTVAPQLLEIIPGKGADRIGRDAKIQVAFSQPMDTAATESAFSLTGPTGIAIPGKFAWDEKRYKLIFEPDELLDYGTLYEIRVDRIKARSDNGGLIAKEGRSSFTTVDAPDIVGTSPNDGATTDEMGSFTVYFSAPARLDDFKSRVTIDPKPKLASYGTESDDSGFFYRLNFGAEPSTTYTITIDTNGLVDRYGTPFKLNPRSKLYSIVAPGKAQVRYVTLAYPPSASLKTGSDIGLYSAYRPVTRVFTMHRNIQSVNLTLWSLPIQDFLRMTGSNSYYFQGNYRHQSSDFLRRWTVPVYNPPNAMRYDLLTISERGTSVGQKNNIICVDAAPTRLDIGQSVTVLKDDLDPYRLRDEAGMEGIIVSQVKPGVELTIIDGPICADKFVWWKLRSQDETISGWGVEGDRVKYFIGPVAAAAPTQQATAAATVVATASATEQAPINIAPLASGQADDQSQLQPGMYWLEFSSPDLPERARKINHLMIVATANITLKITPKDVLAWVTDLQSGQPVANIDVQLYAGAEAKVVGTPMQTDADGLARFALPDTADTLYNNLYAVVSDGGNFGVSASRWSGGIAPGDFNQRYDFYPENATVYLYSDRSLYRPGQTVYYRGVLRARDDMTYTLSDRKKVHVQVYDPQGRSVYEKDIAVNDFGTFADSFAIDPTAALGNFRIVVQPDIRKSNGDRMLFERQISVAEYRTPEFQVKLNAEQGQVVQGDKIKVKVDSTFFFGGPVNNANIAWTVTSDVYYFRYGAGRYSFYDYNEDLSSIARSPEYDHSIAKGEGKTDDQGAFTIEIPADLGKIDQSQTFTIEARVTDESNRLVAGSTQVIVHQGEFYIGAAAENYVGAASQPQNINLITIDWNGKPRPNADLSVRVVERAWNSVQTIEPGTGRVVWEYEVKENPIADSVVHTDANGKAVFQFTPPRGGAYKVYATSRDTHSNQIRTSAFLWIAGPDYVPWRQQNSNRIDLKVDRDSFKVGDTASILIASPFQGATTALITVERGGILKTNVVTLTTNSAVYKLPITPDMAPNAYVSVTVIKGVDSTNPVAAFRMGMLQLGVDVDQLALKINVTPDKTQAGPRETVTYKLHVTNYAGEPVRAEVGVGLTDLAVLSMLPDTSTPILQHFYGQQSLSVRTVSSLTLSVDQQTQQILNVVKGGGGGGPEGGIFEVRQLFIDTPLWKPSVLTDDDGNATVSVTLPDQLTTWRLDVRAVTLPTDQLKTTLVGQTTLDLVSTKPLLIRPVTPRFYVAGDKSTLAAIVNNNTDQPQEVSAYIDAKGLAVVGSAVQTPYTATIQAHGRLRFEWPVQIQDVDEVSVTFFAATTDKKYGDAAKSAVGQGDDKTLPVLHYRAPDTISTAGLIGKDGGDTTEGISIPAGLDVADGQLDIRVEPSLAASATSALKMLRNYPYQCIEQTVSRFLPNLMTYRSLKQLGLDDGTMRNKLSDAISFAVQQLYNEQHTDGGWGWFVQEDSSSPVTAYALIGLVEAKKEGFSINQDVIKRAIYFVQRRVQEMPEKADFSRLSRQAFLLYALARANAGDTGRSVRLYEYRNQMALYARAYLAMALRQSNANAALYVDPLMKDLQNHAIVSPSGIAWQESGDDYLNWNTDVRTTAIVLQALVEIQPDSPLILDTIRWLMAARHGEAWDTTQETAWAVMALTEWMQISGELKANYTFAVGLNGVSLMKDQKVTPDLVLQTLSTRVAIKDLLRNQVNRLTFERTPGDGILYYTANLTVFLPVDQVKSVTRGLSIRRTYSLLSDKDRKPITQARIGDVIRVTLDIVAPDDVFYVAITDPIPAGTEAIDPNLPTSGTIGKAPELRLNNPLSLGWGWWWFSKTELRDDRAVLYASYLPKGTYQYTYSLRAGLAGEYRVIPASGEAFYTRLIYGRSDGALFTILPATQ